MRRESERANGNNKVKTVGRVGATGHVCARGPQPQLGPTRDDPFFLAVSVLIRNMDAGHGCTSCLVRADPPAPRG